MKTKILEIRDSGTFIPVVAVDMNPENEAQRYYLRRSGFPCDGAPNIAITHIRASGDPCWNDPFGWGGRTYPVAHNYIIQHWHEMSDGDVVDVAFILGETETPKVSERIGEAA
jgi:hypothetical protein